MIQDVSPQLIHFAVQLETSPSCSEGSQEDVCEGVLRHELLSMLPMDRSHFFGGQVNILDLLKGKEMLIHFVSSF